MQAGLAKAQFVDSHHRSPWLAANRSEEQRSWPFVEELLRKQRLSYLDYVMARRLLRDQAAGQEVALFICHLLMAAKEGHLCLQIKEERLYPAVAQLWSKEAENPLTTEESTQLSQMIIKGAYEVPPSLITSMPIKEALELPHTPICRYQGCFYLQRHWIFETVFLKSLKQHLQSIPSLKVNEQKMEEQLEDLCQKQILLKEQAQAILQASLSSLSLITGGPGTGKTYTAGWLIQLFWNSLSDEQKKTCEIVLAAPTGKAAANLQRSLSAAVGAISGFPALQAKTLHALLGIKHNSSFKEVPRLTADLVVVDESSMIDVKMMACLFEALKRGSRLILLGDRHQLPSVEAGSVFVDLIQLPFTHPELAFPCTQLSICLRAELSSIVSLAQTINEGKSQQALSLLNQPTMPGISRLQLPLDRKEAQRVFLKHVMAYFPSVIKSGQEEESLLNLFNAIRILSPMRRGAFGVDALNELMWQHVSQLRHASGWLAIPILIAMNDYRQDLFNGETGVLMRRLPLKAHSPEDYALFPSRNPQEKVRRFAALLLPRYEYAYCLSVHKSQGSEFDRVILVLPEGSELFGREVFYTAVTRARKHIEVCGSDDIIEKTISQQDLRLSGIGQRLTQSAI